MVKYQMEFSPLYFWKKGSLYNCASDAIDEAERFREAARVIEIDETGNKREVYRNELAKRKRTARGGGVKPMPTYADS